MTVTNVLATNCKEAIALLRSCSQLISELLQYPRRSMDGALLVQSFEEDKGLKNMRRLQSMTNAHLERVASVCMMQDEEVLLLDDAACPRERKAELSKTYRDTIIALKTVDKPNLHRLRELAFCTLPMVGQIVRIGELVLEKTHQILKRAVSRSNNQKVQLHAMHAAAIGDWQGRLTMLANNAFSTGNSVLPALRGCLRLLRGRETIIALQGNITKEHSAYVLRALGSPLLMPRELSSHGRTVLSPRIFAEEVTVKWKLPGAHQIAPCDAVDCADVRKILSTLRVSYGSDLKDITVKAGKTAFSKYSTQVEGTRFKLGDVLEILCYDPNNARFHYPLVVQVSDLPHMTAWERSSGPSLWCALQFLAITTGNGRESFLAVVLPCTATTQSEKYPDQHRLVLTE